MSNLIEFVAKIPNWPFTIVAALIAFGVSIYLFRRKRFSDAYDIFHAAFDKDVAELQSPVSTGNVRDFLIKAFDRHGEAVTNFRKHLKGCSQSRFDQAWQQYHSGHCFDAEAWNIPPKERLFMDYFSMENDSEAAKIYLKRIHKLLYYEKRT